MSAERGHQSIYFRDPEVLRQLETLTADELKDTSISALVCEVMGKALPEIIKHAKKGKRGEVELTFKINL